ncbi:unnamed protein product, partial [Closterium sp. Naga37s-1]
LSVRHAHSWRPEAQTQTMSQSLSCLRLTLSLFFRVTRTGCLLLLGFATVTSLQ